MRTLFLLSLTLLLVVPAGAGPEAPRIPIVTTLEETFERLGLESHRVRVHDVDFWTAWAPRLRASGRMVASAVLPTERDGLRPLLVDRALRRPLEAVALAQAVVGRKAPPPLGALVGALPPGEVVLGEDPIAPEADVHANVRWLARGLAGLEDAVAAALPRGNRDPRMTRWMIEGIDSEEIGEARVAFDRFADTDLQPVLLRTLSFLREVSARLARSEGLDVGGPIRVETPRGLVIVGTGEDDVHEEDAWLLVDPDGDDVYENNAGGTGTALRAALCLDLSGADRYASDEPFTQGGAWRGLSVLFDASGDDAYRGGAFCQGAALGGVAVLLDEEGNDVFEACEFAQGAAGFGYGVLLSGQGDDRFALDRLGQGFGRTGGYGVLRDTSGNEHYLARPTHESTYSQWTGGRQIHWSFAQGCGLGFYARYQETLDDGTEGLVIRDLLPGGVGVILDAAGDDVYEGSMYAQGTGYFYGLGLCADLQGDDTYTATWYGQGAAPHFAVGILVDASGDDRYTGMHQVQGNGRDFSTAVLLDLAGNDTYRGEDRIQGCGDRRDGYGIFVDAAGNDRYDAKRRAARGWATTVKPEEQPTSEVPFADYGIFLDLGGDDVYEGKAAGEDGGTWVQEATGRGIGIDR